MGLLAMRKSLKAKNFSLPSPALHLCVVPRPGEVDKRRRYYVTDLTWGPEKVEVVVQYTLELNGGLKRPANLALWQLGTEQVQPLEVSPNKGS